MDDFILIFRHQEGRKVAPPEQLEIWMKQSVEWINKIAAKKRLGGGSVLLFDESKIVWSNKVTEGPFGEVKETVGGYIIVKADSVEEAVEFAKGCPILQVEGNSVEVRKIASKDEGMKP